MRATTQQIKMFYALCGEGGWDKTLVAERAKSIYSLKSFSDITSVQISPLINQMQQKVKEQVSVSKKLEEALKKATANMNRPIHLRLYNRNASQMQFNSYNHVNGGTEQNGLVMYFPFGYSLGSTADEADLDLMQGTGKYDVNNVELYHYDIFMTKDKTQYMVEWSKEDLCWIAVNMATNELKTLSLFGKVQIIGDVYQGLIADRA